MSQRSLDDLLDDWRTNRDALNLLDLTVLTYARAQGLTNESEIERLTAKGLLDDLILQMQDEDWEKLQDYAGALGPQHLKGFRRHGLAVLEQDLKDQAADLEHLPDWEISPNRTPPSPPRRRDRDDDRD